MNNTLKTSAVLLTLSLALTTGAAIAAPTAVPQNGKPEASANAGLQAFTIEINGTSLTDTGYQTPGGKEPLIPLRAVADALGFKLTWNAETKSVDLNQGNIFTTVKTGEDRYVINKMYKSLGTVPQLKENKLYVPASFASEVLHQSVTVKGKAIVIAAAEQAGQHMTETGVITAINKSDKYQSVQIKGTGTEGIVLNVGKDTVFEMADGTVIALADLHIGMTVKAEHSMIATLSLPPQTPTYKITVLDQKKQNDLLGTAGTLEEVIKAEDGTLSLRIKGSGLTEVSQSEVVLRLAADTVLINGDGEAVQSSTLVKGAKVIGFYSPLMTKSLPPIGTAVKVVVEAPQQ